MNTNEVLQRLQVLGLRGKVRETGHPDFIRVFAECDGTTPGIPLSLGRITIHKGEYSHAKWYVEGADLRGPLNEHELLAIRWNHWEATGVLLSNEQIREAEALALAEAKTKLKEKLAWREANPHPKGKHGRKRIRAPNARGLLGKYLQPKEPT